MTIARRRFLTASALLAAGAGLARTAQAKVQPVKLENRKFEPLKLPRPISLAALTVLDVSPANQVLCAAKAGYSHVGIRLVPATPTETQWDMIGDTPMIREVEANLRATGVKVLDIEILRVKPDTRAINWKPFFETGARLGASQVLVAGNDPDYNRFCDNFAELCEIAHPYGLTLNVEPMPWCDIATVKAAGDAMKRLLARLTATPLLGVLTGLAVTAVLQSSSAATVMVIGFVSAGLLELPRAVAVIYGINIGTTMTAQLIAFDVQTLVYPVLFLGFLLDFAARRPRWQAVGEAVFSFGLLFEGIDILGRALHPLAGQTVFLDWMTRVKESPLLGILLGLSMTMVVQSSSATIALLQNVARQAGPDGIHSVLGLAGAVPVLLGDNIGTTVTALLACIGQGKNAARAALAHSCFNLSGSLLAAVLLPWFVRLVEFISPKGPELEVISRQIANAHTAFNVCCALLWLPLLPWMVRLVCALVPEE